ncbi:MAG: phosphoglycerate kinase, partial [Alphaproteobacteria bacterium]|nr:phosphoglycerate kinase [Alphaproteobacteria bacterium]
KDVTLLENIRFHSGEESNDSTFAKKLASMGDIYVNDAFSAAHRAHASTEGLAHLLPSAAGLLMETELSALESALQNPKTPVLAIVGGSKISTKLNVLRNLLPKVDYLVLGGAMPNTFLAAQGIDIGKSLYEPDMLNEAKEIMDEAKKQNCEIILPKDYVVVEDLQYPTDHDTVSVNAIPQDKMAVDMGPESTQHLKSIIGECHTILWNGPLGVFEIKPFDRATNEIAKFVSELTLSGQITSVAGGGDTVAALENANTAQDMSYISTAGGAFLEWLEGKDLPGVIALKKATPKAA